ncbi:MAG: MotA/TolQ/ExbB proton channel family protein [Chlamydiota bacterium]
MCCLFLSIPLFQAYSESDFFGKLVFLTLFFLSAVSWVILLHKMHIVRTLRKSGEEFSLQFKGVKEHILSVKIEPVLHPYFELYHILKQKTIELLQKNRFFLETQGKGNSIVLSQADIELVASHMETTIAQQARLIEKNLFILSTVVTLGPFIGLLGTVWGILITFSHLQSHAVASSNAAVLSGLSMALGTTIFGLVVAIPALVAYNYLKNCSRELVHDMEVFSHSLLSTIEIQYRKVSED